MLSDLQRITTIGDSVFAVALTLLAAGVRLPPDLMGKSLTAADLAPMLSDMSAVALSFCVASVFWLGHWVYLRKVVRTTVPFLVSNLAVLLCIILLPISTRILSAGPTSTASAAVYSANLLATSFAEMLFRRQAVAMSVPLGAPPPPPRVHRHLAPIIALGVHTGALVAAFIDPNISVWLWLSAFFIPGIEAWVHRKNRAAPAVTMG
ncbi:MAG: hypothetical protein JWQ11_1772 [Rhizobacter sp.]|nr:hypothetical protein [Rhizobacter sp.]